MLGRFVDGVIHCPRARVRIDAEPQPIRSRSPRSAGVWYLDVVMGLPDAVIAAQAGLVRALGHETVATHADAVSERRLDEIDAARATKRDPEPNPRYGASSRSPPRAEQANAEARR